MRFEATFKTTDQSFAADFGAVQTASDGGYERGYESGYEKGHTEGYDKGHTEGHDAGYSEGYDKGLADGAGESAELEAKIDESGILYGTEKTIDEKVDGLIDVAKIYGQSSTLSFGNNRSLTSIDFYIPYTGIGCAYMFANTNNLKHMVGINTSKVTDFTFMFQNSGIEVIDEPLDFSSAKGAGAFAGNTTIREVRIVEGSLKISVTFPSAVLSDESIQSIIDGLADLTGGTQQTLTLNATVTAKLTEAQIATITRKNWVVA